MLKWLLRLIGFKKQITITKEIILNIARHRGITLINTEMLDIYPKEVLRTIYNRLIGMFKGEMEFYSENTIWIKSYQTLEYIKTGIILKGRCNANI